MHATLTRRHADVKGVFVICSRICLFAPPVHAGTARAALFPLGLFCVVGSVRRIARRHGNGDTAGRSACRQTRQGQIKGSCSSMARRSSSTSPCPEATAIPSWRWRGLSRRLPAAWWLYSGRRTGTSNKRRYEAGGVSSAGMSSWWAARKRTSAAMSKVLMETRA